MADAGRIAFVACDDDAAQGFGGREGVGQRLSCDSGQPIERYVRLRAGIPCGGRDLCWPEGLTLPSECVSLNRPVFGEV